MAFQHPWTNPDFSSRDLTTYFNKLMDHPALFAGATENTHGSLTSVGNFYQALRTHPDFVEVVGHLFIRYLNHPGFYPEAIFQIASDFSSLVMNIHYYYGLSSLRKANLWPVFRALRMRILQIKNDFSSYFGPKAFRTLDRSLAESEFLLTLSDPMNRLDPQEK